MSTHARAATRTTSAVSPKPTRTPQVHRALQAEAHAQRCAAEALRWQTELAEVRAGAQQQEVRARELRDELSERLARVEGQPRNPLKQKCNSEAS